MEGIMHRKSVEDTRRSENTILSSSNVYEQLLDYQGIRSVTERGAITRYRELLRLLEAKSTYLNKIRASRKERYRTGATDITCKTLGEHLCVIGDMPGWYFPDSSLAGRHTYYAIGANGSLYITKSLDRDDFICVDTELAAYYPSDELAQIADALEASIAADAGAMLELIQKRAERLRAHGLN
jgi:hypothetical protein